MPGYLNQFTTGMLRRQNAASLLCRQTEAGPGINYYRLKLADADGKITYSAVVALFNKASGFRIVQVMPIGAGFRKTANCFSGGGEYRTGHFRHVGKKLSSLKASLQPGNNLIDLPVENLSREYIR